MSAPDAVIVTVLLKFLWKRYPRKMTKSIGKKKQTERNKLKPFIRVISYSHLLPTRYSVDVNFDKTSVNKEALKEPKKKRRGQGSS